MDTDRLPEEKARGISIDLGFAYLRTPGGPTIGFVDVPGHERFVRNMLAGVCGIDFVLLHEGLGCVELWREFPEFLSSATGCGVFAYSRAGYGKSDPAALPRALTYMQDAAREEVGAVLDAASIGRCVLVGHSDGASIAALVDDARVAGMVLISPHYFVEAMCLDAIQQARDAFMTGNLRERLARYHDHVDVAFHGWSGAWLDPGFQLWDIRNQVSDMRVPVLQVQGRDDPYGSSAQPAALGGASVTTLMLDAKHAPHLEAAEATLGAIVGFVARL